MSSLSNTRNIAVIGILTAVVAVLQGIGAAIRFGTFSVSLVLIPIVVGAAIAGPAVGAWLGFVFSVIVLITDAGAFLAISIPGTILTVLLKGTLAGYGAGLVYQALHKKYRLGAVAAAALVCPVINTGIFLVGCRLFFFDTLSQWAAGLGFESTYAYMILGLVGANFLFEVLLNLVLSPQIVRLIDYYRSRNK